MGWRPSSWWARSQDREPVADAPPETASLPVAEPGRPATGAWRDLPVLTPVTASPVQRVAGGEDFAAGLAAHTDPRFLQRLSHVVDPSVGGLVDGLAVSGEPHRRDAGPDLAVPARPSRPVPRVQRRLAEWQGAEELPTVRWELPDLDDHQPEVGVPSRAAVVAAAPDVLAPAPTASPAVGQPLSRPAVQRAVSVEPPRAPRAETPADLQRQLAPVVAPPSPGSDAPSAPVDPIVASAVDEKPVPLPPVPDSSSAEPDLPDQVHDHDLNHDQDSAAVTGWTEVALPVAPVEQTLPGSPSVQRAVQPTTPGPGPAETRPVAHPDARAEARPEVRPVTRADPELPAVQRQPSAPTTADAAAPHAAAARTAVRPVKQPSPGPAAEPRSAPPEETRPVPTPLAVGIPLVQRLATDGPVGGSAMSFTSMFARPSPAGEASSPDQDGPDHDVVSPSAPEPAPAPILAPSPTPAPSPLPAPPVVARSVIVGAPSVTSVTRVAQPSAGPVPTSSPAHTSMQASTTWADQTAAARVTPVVVSRSITPPALPTTTQSGFAMAALQRQSQPGHTQPAAQASPGQVLHRLSLQRDPADEAASAESMPTPTEESSPAEASGTSGADSGASASTAAPAPPPGAAPAAGGAAAPADIDEMARRLYEPLVARIRAELWLDRERSGVFGHG